VLKVAEAEPLSAEALDMLWFVVEREISETPYPAEVIRRSLDGLYREWSGRRSQSTIGGSGGKCRMTARSS
jgi:hypothetical protein